MWKNGGTIYGDGKSVRRQFWELGNEELEFGHIAFEMPSRQPNRDESRQLKKKKKSAV